MRAKLALWILPAFGAAGCSHAPAQRGESAFTIVRPPSLSTASGAKAAATETSTVDYREAQAIHPLAMPVYPAAALAAKAGWAQVGVHVTIDRLGRVTDVSASAFVPSTPGPFAGAFREAVEVAVRQWAFRPAEILYLEKVQAPEVTYMRIARRETIEARFDMAFTFTATGGVMPGK
jgi:outer membrane biosynthesis protein TonB